MTDIKTIKKARRYSNWALRSLYFLLFSLAILLPVLVVVTVAIYGSFGTISAGYVLAYFGSIVICIIAISASAYVETRRMGSKWYAFGLNFDKFAFRQFIFGGALALGSSAVFILAALAYGFKIAPGQATSLALVHTFLFFFFGAAAEELLGRGIFFQAIDQRFGGAVATIVMSFIFAASHIFNPEFAFLPFINTFLAGVLLSVMYIFTRSLWLPISFHFFWNFFQQVLLGSPVSGVDFGVHVFEISFVPATAPVITIFGGAYGIEAGVLTTLLLVASIIPVVKYSNISPYLSSILYKRDYNESKLIHGEFDDGEELSGHS